MDRTARSPFVIVGASLAGAKTAEGLRDAGHDGAITLVGAEAHLPYERPPLSKGFLQGHEDRQKLLVHPPDWYADHRVDLRLSSRVTAVNSQAHHVAVSNGDRLPYEKLVLATGSAPRRLTVQGADLAGVHYLRTVDDSEALKQVLSAGTRVTVIGAGWIGLETAAAARAAGADVTVLEHADVPLLRVLGARLGTVFADLHRAHGVDLRCGVTVTGMRAREDNHDRVGAVLLSDGNEVTADVVIVGVGVAPNDHLARTAGLKVDNGIVVDEQLRTSNPDVYAVGDVANAYHPLLQRHMRVEHWATALNQPAVAARVMLGQGAAYDALPYFFSDQYDLGMEYVGHADPDDGSSVVVRGDLGSREFVAFWVKTGRVVAGMNVNVWDVADAVKSLIRSGVVVDPARLADPGVPLTELT
ncbi:MAG: NAD(P)/FAD-dependent oxidoreductase [Actinomycetes bacterium]